MVSFACDYVGIGVLGVWWNEPSTERQESQDCTTVWNADKDALIGKVEQV